MPINLIRSRSINYIQRKWFSLPNIYIFRIYPRSFLIFLTKALSNFSYTSLFTLFCRHKSFHSSFTFSQNSLSNVSIKSPFKFLNSLPRKIFFPSTPPKKTKKLPPHNKYHNTTPHQPTHPPPAGPPPPHHPGGVVFLYLPPTLFRALSGRHPLPPPLPVREVAKGRKDG